MTNTDRMNLPEAIAATEASHPGWHIWQTRSGRFWAATQVSDYPDVGSGTTLDSDGGLAAMERAIGEWEWRHARALGGVL